MNRKEYLDQVETIKKNFSTSEEQILHHERLLCEYVHSLEKQLNLFTGQIELVAMNIGDIVLINDHERLTLHYVTFYGKDENLAKFWKYDGNVTKLDGTYAFFREDGRLLGDPKAKTFPVRVFHNYDIRFKCTSDR